MRLYLNQRKKGRVLLWFGIALLLIQLGLALGVDQFWSSIRDPDYQALQDLIQQNQQIAPDRPLVLALGSSRTLLALKADLLNDATDSNAPLVINAALSGSGPMLQQITLRRLLAAGIHPEMVFLEIMPVSLSQRGGAPLEERHKWTCRYTAEELSRIHGYYSESYRLYYPWIQSRLLPTSIYQRNLHQVFVGYLDPGGHPSNGDRNQFGWSGCPREFSREEINRLTTEALADYSRALKDPLVASGPCRALEDSIDLCQKQSIAVVIVVPPESKSFRTLDAQAYSSHFESLDQIAAIKKVPLVNASQWIDDSGFWDGHHATRAGAEQYTKRFAIEVLAPYFRRVRLVQSNS